MYVVRTNNILRRKKYKKQVIVANGDRDALADIKVILSSIKCVRNTNEDEGIVLIVSISMIIGSDIE